MNTHLNELAANGPELDSITLTLRPSEELESPYGDFELLLPPDFDYAALLEIVKDDPDSEYPRYTDISRNLVEFNWGASGLSFEIIAQFLASEAISGGAGYVVGRVWAAVRDRLGSNPRRIPEDEAISQARFHIAMREPEVAVDELTEIGYSEDHESAWTVVTLQSPTHTYTVRVAELGDLATLRGYTRAAR